MPAVAAVLNNAVPEEASIQLYFNTGSAQIAVALKTGTDGADPDTEAYAAGQDDYPGYILNPSEVAGGNFRGVNIVAAVTKPFVGEGATQTVNQISLVAPVYQKLATTSLANKTTAFAASTKNAWVYFLDGTANNQITLKEYNFVNGKIAAYRKNQDITLNSSLASWYEPKSDNRFVIYQELDQGHLKEYNVTTNQTWDIDSTEGALEGTTIAATFFEGRTYLYFIDGGSNVRRVIKDEGTWGDSKVVRNSPKIGTSQLTVTTANRYNHLFYISQDNTLANDFTHITDPVVEKS